jgi:hypothetical protein
LSNQKKGFLITSYGRDGIKKLNQKTSCKRNKGWEIRKQCKSNAKASNLHMPIEDVNEDINKIFLRGGLLRGGKHTDQIRFMESFSNTYEQVIGSRLRRHASLHNISKIN